MEYVYKQYIDGAWIDAKNGGTSDVLDPACEETLRIAPFGPILPVTRFGDRRKWDRVISS